MFMSPFIRTNNRKKSPFSWQRPYYSGNVIVVKPYFRGSGRLVHSHLRTKPDGIKVNNFSFWK